MARSIFDSNNLGRLKLFGAVLSQMELDASGRLATVYVDQQLARDCGGTYEDTEGLINLPLTVKEIQAVVFFKENGPDDWRVSMRSKGEVDVNAVAKAVRRRRPQERLRLQRRRPIAELKALFRDKITEQIDKARCIERSTVTSHATASRSRLPDPSRAAASCPLPAAADGRRPRHRQARRA